MKTQVTQTSIQTYYSLDFSSVRGKVAGEIIRLTSRGERAYIGKVAHNLKMEKSTVSGRFNELKKQPFQFDGYWYRMVQTGNAKAFYGVRQTTVQTWAALRCAAPAEQTALPL